jgi:hypothetical protein
MSPFFNNFLSRNLLLSYFFTFPTMPLFAAHFLLNSLSISRSISFHQSLHIHTLHFQASLLLQIYSVSRISQYADPFLFESISFCKIISVQKIHLSDLFLYEIYLFASPSIVSISSFAESLPFQESLRFQMLSLKRTLN